MNMKKETYAAATKRLHAEFKCNGRETSSPTLKRPWAMVDGHRVEFHAQAVYLDGHSLFIDRRGMTMLELMTAIQRRLWAQILDEVASVAESK